MIFININQQGDASKLKKVQEEIQAGKYVYVMVYMDGCPACVAAHPEWNKVKKTLESTGRTDLLNNDQIVWVDMNKDFLSHPDNTFVADGRVIGFPTFLLLGKRQDELSTPAPPVATDFVNWIGKTASKSADPSSPSLSKKTLRGGRRRRRHRTKRRGGKWSRKYKRSINCRRPRGFSQKQYCRYSRR